MCVQLAVALAFFHLILSLFILIETLIHFCLENAKYVVNYAVKLRHTKLHRHIYYFSIESQYLDPF